LELRYYIDDSEDLDSDDDDGDALVNFLALRVEKTKNNNLDTLSNAYKPHDEAEEKKFIVIEFRSDKDFKNLIANFEKTSFLKAYVSDAQIHANDVKQYCRTLIDDSKKEQWQRLKSAMSPAAARTGFLAGKKDDDIVLVYPFGDDGREVDAAAQGLTELQCVDSAATEADGKSEGDATVELTAKVYEEEPSIETDASNEKGKGNAVKSRAVFQICVADVTRLEPGEYLNDTLIDFWMHW
jgi:hypothetical protein